MEEEEEGEKSGLWFVAGCLVWSVWASLALALASRLAAARTEERFWCGMALNCASVWSLVFGVPCEQV